VIAAPTVGKPGDNFVTQPIPDGFHTLTPHLVCAGASDAITFMTQAFGAVEVNRLAADDGRLLNAQLRIGNSMLMVVDEFPEWGTAGPQALKSSPVTIHLFVEDVDAVVARAVAAGATVTMPVADMFWGDRYGVLQDPFGHAWSVATHQRDLTPQQIAEGMRSAKR
jgi:PhnB protein